MAEFLFDREIADEINWDTDDLWRCRFYKNVGGKIYEPPTPFNDWFPADSISIDEVNLLTFNYRVQMIGTFELPVSIGMPALSMTYYDTDDKVLSSWIKDDWIYDTIMDSGRGIKPIRADGVLRDLICVRLDNEFRYIYYYVFSVFPKGVQQFRGISKRSVARRTVNFSVYSHTGLQTLEF